MLCAEANHHHRGDHVDESHDRHQHRRDLCDGSYAANNHGSNYRRQREPEQPATVSKKRGLAAGDHHELRKRLIGLKHIANAQTANDQRQCIESAKALADAWPPPLSKIGLHIKHRATRNRTVSVIAPILNAQRALHQLGRHRQKPSDEQPERRTRATEGDRHGHAANVTHADCAGHRSRNRLEVTDLTAGIRIREISAGVANREPQRSHIDEPQIKREKQAGHRRPHHNQRHIGASNGHRIEHKGR